MTHDQDRMPWEQDKLAMVIKTVSIAFADYSGLSSFCGEGQHEFNLATDTDSLLHGLENIFIEVARLRDAGRLDNPTMGELATALELKDKKEKVKQ